MTTEEKVGVDHLALDNMTYHLEEAKKSLEHMKKLELLTNAQRTAAEQKVVDYALSFRMSKIDMDALDSFFKKPYPRPEPARDPKGRLIPNTWRLIIPRFVPLNMGWLEFQDDSFNYFRVNRQMDWFGEIPDFVKKQLGWKEPPDLKLEGGELVGPREVVLKAIERLHGLVQMKDGKALVNKDRYYDLLVALLKEGVKPFPEQPVDPADLIERKCDYELRPYQADIWVQFCRFSHIGVFIPPGTGKTVLGAYGASHLKPPHLVVVPTLMLKEQWEERIESHTDLKLGEEVYVATYVTALTKLADMKFTLKIYDEVHHIAAKYYVKLFGIGAKYSMGLSATPYREDQGGEELVYALTGYPTGLGWQYFRELNLIKSPILHVWIEKGIEAKKKRLAELLSVPKKTIVFCDFIEPGKEIAAKFNAPFVYGATKDRLQTIKDAPLVVVSRVGDEGVSLPDIERVIEYSWNYGSRRQELQRHGRLQHSQMLEQEMHTLMTFDEFAHDKKRFYSIYDKGFKVVPHREGISDKIMETSERSPLPRRQSSATARTHQQGTAPVVPLPQIPLAVTQRLPGIGKTLERLSDVEKAAATVILGNPQQSYSAKELSLSTGYAAKVIANGAHFNKLIELGLIKKDGTGKYKSAL